MPPDFVGPVTPKSLVAASTVTCVTASAEVGVTQLQQGGPAREVLLGDAEALADDVAEVVRDHVVLGRRKLGEAPAGQGLGHGRLDQQDAGARSDRVRGLHVGGGLTGRLHHVLVVRVIGRHLAHGLQYPQGRRPGQAESAVEDPQVMADRGGPERVHDDDRAAPAVQAPGVQRAAGRRPAASGAASSRPGRSVCWQQADAGGAGAGPGGTAGVRRWLRGLMWWLWCPAGSSCWPGRERCSRGRSVLPSPAAAARPSRPQPATDGQASIRPTA